MIYARPMFPPPVGGEDRDPRWGVYDAGAHAFRDRHPLAALILLRQEAAEMVERLLNFLDVTDGLDVEEQVDDEPCDTDELEEDRSDDEPSLGWTRCGALGGGDDREVNEVAA